MQKKNGNNKVQVTEKTPKGYMTRTWDMVNRHAMEAAFDKQPKSMNPYATTGFELFWHNTWNEAYDWAVREMNGENA